MQARTAAPTPRIKKRRQESQSSKHPCSSVAKTSHISWEGHSPLAATPCFLCRTYDFPKGPRQCLVALTTIYRLFASRCKCLLILLTKRYKFTTFRVTSTATSAYCYLLTAVFSSAHQIIAEVTFPETIIQALQPQPQPPLSHLTPSAPSLTAL